VRLAALAAAATVQLGILGRPAEGLAAYRASIVPLGR
jgi:hypothetical protein